LISKIAFVPSFYVQSSSIMSAFGAAVVAPFGWYTSQINNPTRPSALLNYTQEFLPEASSSRKQKRSAVSADTEYGS
jgi:hypothetical protein